MNINFLFYEDPIFHQWCPFYGRDIKCCGLLLEFSLVFFLSPVVKFGFSWFNTNLHSCLRCHSSIFFLVLCTLQTRHFPYCTNKLLPQRSIIIHFHLFCHRFFIFFICAWNWIDFWMKIFDFPISLFISKSFNVNWLSVGVQHPIASFGGLSMFSTFTGYHFAHFMHIHPKLVSPFMSVNCFRLLIFCGCCHLYVFVYLFVLPSFP